jgi:hypothetical protein
LINIYELPTATNAAHGEHTHTVIGSTANNSGSETRPKNVYVLYLIKY